MDDRQLIEDLLSALEYHTEQTRPIEFSKVAIEAAREYLRKPPQRPWVGLTDEEAEEVWKRVEASDFRDCVHPFAQAIEAELRSKNT